MNLDLIGQQHKLEIKAVDGKRMIWDVVRRKWLVLQPEEMVRQLIVHHLIAECGCNRNRITLERGLTVNGMYRRSDVLVYDPDMQPFLLVECKAPSIPVNEAVFRQIATYNMSLRVPYLWVSNGPDNYVCAIDFETESFTFLDEIPAYPDQHS
jgi:hypothetical protein